MSEQTEEVTPPQIDPEHPYVLASIIMDPEPSQVAIKIEGMLLEFNGQEMPAAQMTVVTSVGVQVVYLSPRQLAAMLTNGAEVLEMFRPKEPGLIVPDTATINEVTKNKRSKK